LEALKGRALLIAKTQIGVQERGGKNTGPEVDAYLDAVFLPPGQNWCCAFVVWAHVIAAMELHVTKLPFPRTGKVTRLWQATNTRFGKRWPPAVGDIYCHATDPLDPDSTGHCGLVTAVHANAFTAIEGNTNREGSRTGDSVWEHPRPRAYANLGFIDISHEITVRIRRATS
jgi:hypothetical protein